MRIKFYAIFIILGICLGLPAAAMKIEGSVSVYYDENGVQYIYVKEHTRKDGTVVKGYYRSMPDETKLNNWSTKGNINPFTGKKGDETP